MELGEDPLLGRVRDEPGVPAYELLGLRNEPKIEGQLVLEPGAAQQPQGVVAEDGLTDRAQAPRREIAEERAAGTITTKEEALEYARRNSGSVRSDR